jgi:hypothetical protein
MATGPADLLRCWVARQAGQHAVWFEERLVALASGAPERELHLFLGTVGRIIGKADLVLDEADIARAKTARAAWHPKGWSVDGAARVAALLVHKSDLPFAERFKDLRRTADAAELVALYRGLPLYPDPDALAFEVSEGLRSNVRAVFEAIAHENPFPSERFDEHRWNQMVLKALFVGSRLAPIVGLEERANPELASILRDYAHERWAAGRSVSPELWRCVGPFAADDSALDDLERVLTGNPTERAAAALALAASPAPRARDLLATMPELSNLIRRAQLSWAALPEGESVV